MGFQSRLASWAGDIWVPRSSSGKTLTSLWPKPCVISGVPHFKVDTDDYRCFTSLIKPGDMIVIMGECWRLTNRGITNTAFKHLAVYTGAVKAYRDEATDFLLKPVSLGADYDHTGTPSRGIWERTVTHAISDGVVTQDLLEMLLHMVDFAAVVRPWTTPQEQKAIVDFALSCNGLGYNFDFRPDGPPEMYCTELGARSCNAAGIKVPEQVKVNVSWKGLIPGLSKKYLYPAYLADYFVKSYPVVACSKSCASGELARDSKVEKDLLYALLKAPDFNTMP